MSSHLPPLHVVAAIIECEGMLLACRRNADRAQGGKWEFPGGKVEPDETSREALVREIREELDIEVEVTDHFSTDETRAGGRVIRLECLRAHVIGDMPLASSDHDELRWVHPADLSGLEWSAADSPAVRKLAP